MTIPAAHHQKSTTLMSNAPSTGEVTCLNQLRKIHLHILYEATVPIEKSKYSKLSMFGTKKHSYLLTRRSLEILRGWVSKPKIVER